MRLRVKSSREFIFILNSLIFPIHTRRLISLIFDLIYINFL